jgi:F-type H+-transporting ATPase subunit b
MDDRDATLEREMREAQNLTGNTHDLEAEAAAIVDAARSEASRKRQQILEELQTQHQQAIEARQSELAKTYETFKTALAQERETLKSKLISELPLIKETLKAKFSQI